MADINEKPSFLSSVVSGAKGWVKGLLAGGVVGVVTGGLVGVVVGVATGGFGIAALGAAGVGAYVGGSILGSIGSLAGTVTEVVRSREAGQPSANDILNVAKVSYAQGIATGHALSQQQQQEAEQTAFRDRIIKERAAAAQSQIIH